MTEAKFEKLDLVDSLYFPYNINFDIKAEKCISIKIDYSKITSNKPQTFPFAIPEKYELIKYKEK